jgi:hypothetical protein
VSKQPLTYVGTLLIIVGVAVCLLAIFGIRALDSHAQWYLPHFYGEQRAPNVSYDDLFAYATDITKQRGQAECRFYSTLSLSCIILGCVLLAWARDRRKLYSSITEHESTPVA